MFVLDEADEMLSRGFKDQIYEIFQKQSTNIQVRLFNKSTTTIVLNVNCGTLLHKKKSAIIV